MLLLAIFIVVATQQQQRQHLCFMRAEVFKFDWRALLSFNRQMPTQKRQRQQQQQDRKSLPRLVSGGGNGGQPWATTTLNELVCFLGNSKALALSFVVVVMANAR